MRTYMHNSITNIFHASRHHYLNIQRFVLRPRGPNIWTKTIIDANLKKWMHLLQIWKYEYENVAFYTMLYINSMSLSVEQTST